MRSWHAIWPGDAVSDFEATLPGHYADPTARENAILQTAIVRHQPVGEG